MTQSICLSSGAGRYPTNERWRCMQPKYVTTSNVSALVEHGGTVRSNFMFAFDELREETQGSFLQFVNEFTVQPRQHIEPHFHNSHEFYYVLSGEGTMRIGSFISEVHPGQLIYTPPKVPHSLYAHQSGIRCLAFAASFQRIGEMHTPVEFDDWPPDS